MTADHLERTLAEASEALDQGNAAAATRLYRQAIEQAPDNFEAHLMLGSLLGESGQVPEAISVLERALALRPGDAGASLVLARIHSASGALDRAVQLLEAVEDEDAELLYTLGLFEEQRDNRDKALALIQRATELAPEDLAAWFALGSFHMSAGEFEQAESVYRNILEQNPGNVQAAGLLSIALAQSERAEEAEQLLRERLEQSAGDADALADLHYHLAHALKQQGRFGEALESCEQSLARQPDDPRHILKKAEVLEAMGDIDRAFELIRPMLESGSAPVDVVLLFARISHPLGAVEDGKRLLQSFLNVPLTPLHRQNVLTTLEWLENV